MERYLQNCGDWLIIDKKSNKKLKNRYLLEAHFEGYDRVLYVLPQSAKIGNVANPDKRDEYGFLCDETNVDKNIYMVWKNIARRCYDKSNNNYAGYGAKGVTVADEFKTYSEFKNWYVSELNYINFKPEVDKDVLCYINNIDKIYSKNTCLLIPNDINTFISTIGKGIYLTKYNFYCVRLRRTYTKLNKNFKSYNDAVNFKKNEDIKYLELLLDKYNLPDKTINALREYVKIYRYSDCI